MSHIDLRDLDEDDLDAVFDMMRDPRAVERVAFTGADPDDRDAFDEWMLRQRADPDVSLFVITEDGGFAGTAAAYAVDGDPEVAVWVAPHALGRGVGSDALRLLVAREPERPLYARVAAGNAASLALLTKLGFTEVSRTTTSAPATNTEVEELLLALPPTLE